MTEVEVVCIDQYDPYRTMIKKLLPGRAIVTDHFHVVRKANDALDRIRRGMAAVDHQMGAALPGPGKGILGQGTLL